MSFLSIDKVHGDHFVDRKTVTAIPQSVPLADVNTVLRRADSDAENATVRVVLVRPVFEVTTKSGIKLFDGSTGSVVPFVTAAHTKKITDTAWLGVGHSPRPSAETIIPSLRTKVTGSIHQSSHLRGCVDR